MFGRALLSLVAGYEQVHQLQRPVLACHVEPLLTCVLRFSPTSLRIVLLYNQPSKFSSQRRVGVFCMPCPGVRVVKA